MERKKKKVGTVGIAYIFLVGSLFVLFSSLSLILGNNFMILAIKSICPYQRLIRPYQGLIFREVRDLEIEKSVDKYILRIFLLNIFMHNKLPKCDRLTD